MFIRREKPKDYEIVYSVVKAAFGSAKHSDGNEHDLVNALRKGPVFSCRNGRQDCRAYHVYKSKGGR